MGPAPGGPAAPAAGAAAAAGAAGARPADRPIGRPSDAAVEPRTRSGAPAQPAPGRPVAQPGPVSQPGGPGSPVQPGPAPGKSIPPGGPAHPGPPPGKPGVQGNVAQPGQAAFGQPGAARSGQPAPVQPSQVASGQYDPTQDPGQPVVRERDEVLALFWVHMFPIGHMPVAADRPARQVPPPREEFDYAAGIRFEPGDHPRTDLVDSVDRCAALRAGAPLVSSSEPLTRDDLAELTEGHDPLGGENERDWDRRYQVRFGSVTAEGIRPDGLEFAWPPGEQYPEGGSADGEAEVLDEGTEIDRFGTTAGRVFAEAGTRFAQRSLPPSHLDLGYRRYRVLRPLPVWRAVSAAWFAQPGGGVRYRTTHSAIELVALGYLADITTEEP